eukprot:TRINITY_DN572_c0_g1_i1.p2 TRINITY_DN572_c0_g1~~TRINITY_DN572_c0_g1_i1.p2  ORF type:complete len:392 (+),score=111.33 TRINITY_DN572_c0_g1_i1:77-1177(+)
MSATEESPLVQERPAPGSSRGPRAAAAASAALLLVLFVFAAAVVPSQRGAWGPGAAGGAARAAEGVHSTKMHLTGGGYELFGVATTADFAGAPRAQAMGEGSASERGGHTVPYPNPMEVFLSAISLAAAEGLDLSGGGAVAVYADIDLSGWVGEAYLAPAEIFRTFAIDASIPSAAEADLQRLRAQAWGHPVLRLLLRAGVQLTGMWQKEPLPPPPPQDKQGERMSSVIEGPKLKALVNDEDNGRNSVAISPGSHPASGVGFTATQLLIAGVTYCLTENSQFTAMDMSGSEPRKVADYWAYSADVAVTVDAAAAGFAAYALSVTVETPASSPDVARVGEQALRRCPLFVTLSRAGVTTAVTWLKAR